MPSSIPTLKFLLDENVRIELSRFLKEQGLDFKLVSKGSTDKQVALISKSQKRIVVTNDEDFQWFTSDQIYSVIWLSIPQNEPETLIASFKKLITECQNFSGKIVTLMPNEWNQTDLHKE